MPLSSFNADQIDCGLMWIGPQEAKDLLQSNNCNRSIRKNAVEQYAAEMLQDDWQLGCDAIGIDETGTLINGQHRLYAIIKSKKVLPFLIARGLPKASRDALDVGKKRQLHERITIAGYPISAQEASICNQLATPWDYESRLAITTKEMRERIVRIHQRFKGSIDRVMSLKKTGHYMTELTAAVFLDQYLSCQPKLSSTGEKEDRYDGDPVKDFLSLVAHGHRANGYMMPEDGALKVYRETKINARAKNKRVTGMDYYRLVVSGAYKFAEGIPSKGYKPFGTNPFNDMNDAVRQILAS